MRCICDSDPSWYRVEIQMSIGAFSSSLSNPTLFRWPSWMLGVRDAFLCVSGANPRLLDAGCSFSRHASSAVFFSHVCCSAIIRPSKTIGPPHGWPRETVGVDTAIFGGWVIMRHTDVGAFQNRRPPVR